MKMNIYEIEYKLSSSEADFKTTITDTSIFNATQRLKTHHSPMRVIIKKVYHIEVVI